MGDYTEVWFRADIDPTHAHHVGHVVGIASGAIVATPGTGRALAELHRLFTLRRWRSVFAGSSAYWPETGFLTVAANNRGGVTLAFQSQLKNYDGEAEAFFEWVSPLIHGGADSGRFLGYTLGPDSDQQPTLYWSDGRRGRGTWAE